MGEAPELVLGQARVLYLMGHSSRTGDRTPRCPARRTHGSHRTATVPTMLDPVSRNRPDLLRRLAPAATRNVEDRDTSPHEVVDTGGQDRWPEAGCRHRGTIDGEIV